MHSSPRRSYQEMWALITCLLVGSPWCDAAAPHPAITVDSILFVRYTVTYGHVQCMGARSLAGGEGGMYVLSGLKSGNHEIRNVLEDSVFQNGPRKGRRFQEFENGVVRSAELDYEGKRIVFAWSPKSESAGPAFSCRHWREHDHELPQPNEGSVLHIYTVNLDGTDLRQVTKGNWDDLDPTWLPDGRIAFVSQRPQMTVRCAPGTMKKDSQGFLPQNVLFSIKPDGTDLIQLSWHDTNEFMPSVNNEGRIVYSRWDYVDRDFNAAHNFWHCNPDGSNPRSPHGNYYLWKGFKDYSKLDGRAERPWAEYGIRAIPETSGKYLAVSGPHHGPRFGAPIMIDINVRDDYKDAQVALLRPGCQEFPHERTFSCKSNVSNECAYASPWPLDEQHFFISKATGNDLPGGYYRADERRNRINMALYLMDLNGNETWISDCRVPEGGHFLRAQPVRARPRPPVRAVRTFQGERRNTSEHKRAVISVMNVYETDLPFPEDVVRERKIKELRVVQLFPKAPCPGGEDNPKIGYGTGALARAALGTVPVEEDGSAYFEAPVERGIYFQLLDENGAAVQSMRSLTYVHPGEHLSCIGCHEDKWKAPRISATPLAVQRPPSKIKPEPSGSVPVTFGNLVKPVFDNTCAPCHQERGIEPRDYSYDALRDWAFFYFDMGGDGGPNGSRSVPGKIGARGSRMGRALLATHRDMISQEEMRRVTLWLDMLSPKLGSYSIRQEDLHAQEFGGPAVYPRNVAPANPAGVELARPVLDLEWTRENK